MFAPQAPSVAPGETIVWTGVPGSGIIFQPSDAVAIPFSLMWGGFAIFWEAAAVRSGAPLVMALWGIPFVLVGAYMIVGRFLYDAYVRSRTRYAVTDRAAYVEVGSSNPSVRRYSGSELDNVRITKSADGSGTIAFASANLVGRSSNASFWLPSINSFVRVRDVDRAYAAVLAANGGAALPSQ